MVITYPAVFHEEDGSFWVEFPDLPGCQSFGDTLNDTIIGAQEALGAYVLTLWEEGKKLPKAGNLQDISVEDGELKSLVTINLKSFQKDTKAVKKTLTIPSWLNDLAVEKGINFSGLLQEALIKELKITS